VVHPVSVIPLLARYCSNLLTCLCCPTELLLPGRCPELALLLQVVSLLQLPLSGVAAEQGVAVLVDAVAEVLTGHANAGSLPALKVSIVDKVPFLHGYP